MTTNPESLVGTQVHFLGPISIPVSTSMWATAQLMNYSDNLTITDEIVEAGFDRRRAHWLELLDDPAGQIERYGERKFARGPFPDQMPSKDPHLTLADLMTSQYRIEFAGSSTARKSDDFSFTVSSSHERFSGSSDSGSKDVA